MAGVNVPGRDPKGLYLVCWHCDMVRDRDPGSPWLMLSDRAKRGSLWNKISSTHWQTELHGEILDYWPTKRKWRFAGQTQVGDVAKFIASKLKATA